MQQSNSEKTAEGGVQQQQGEPEKGFFRRLFNLPPPKPLREKIETALTEKWQFAEVRPYQIAALMEKDAEEARLFFLSGYNAHCYRNLKKMYGLASETRSGDVVDDPIETIRDHGPQLLSNYLLLHNRETRDLIKRYWGGYYRQGKIGTETLNRIASTNWLGAFQKDHLRTYAAILNKVFKVDDPVIGPMLGSVGDSFALRKVLFGTGPDKFHQLVDYIAAPLPNQFSYDAYVPALQLLLLAEEKKIPIPSVLSFVSRLKLERKDLRAFAAIVYNLNAHRLDKDVTCPTFGMFVRKLLDEFGPDIDMKSAPLFLTAYSEFKDDGEALATFISPAYSETKSYLRSIGVTVPSSPWGMTRVVSLTQDFDRKRVQELIRGLGEEVTLADVVYLNAICRNEEETALLLNKPSLLASVHEIPIQRIVERRHRDYEEFLKREIDVRERSSFTKGLGRLFGLLRVARRNYTEKSDVSRLSSVQMSQLRILQRSFEVPGTLEMLGWVVSRDLQDKHSEAGGYYDYDRDYSYFVWVPGKRGSNKEYRPGTLPRAKAPCCLTHFHATSINDEDYAGPSGWLGAEKGDIDAAAISETSSVIVTTLGHPKGADGKKDKRQLKVNIDFLFIDRNNGHPLICDRGTYVVPYFPTKELPPLGKMSRKTRKSMDEAKRRYCPPVGTVAGGAP
jgi:hypothetical protein